MLLSQSPEEIICLASDTDLDPLKKDFPDVLFCHQQNRNDWGHEKRAAGLDLAQGEWVGFFNDDDSYSPEYLSRMLDQTEGADVVYCAWSTYPNCTFNYGSSTSGNFIVRSDFARGVGWTSRRYEADGDFIESLNEAGARVKRIDDVIYKHNQQPWER